MQLTYKEKRIIESEMKLAIQVNPAGINTRKLISDVYSKVKTNIPNANRHHIAGMIAWIIASTNHKLIVRTPGYSVIV